MTTLNTENLSVTAVVYRARFKITQSIDHSHEGLYLQCRMKTAAQNLTLIQLEYLLKLLEQIYTYKEQAVFSVCLTGQH